MTGAAFLIESVSNNRDGITGTVVLSGEPTGAVAFLAARTPDLDKASVIAATAKPNGDYVIAFAAPVLWYVWARDVTGTTDGSPVWIGLSDNLDLNLCGNWVRDTLRQNQVAIEQKMQFISKGVTIKQIEYGSPALIEDYPSILICRPKFDPRFAFFSYGSEADYSVEVFFMVMHQEKASVIEMAAMMLEAGLAILRQPDYLTVVLESGLPLNITINQGTADEEQADESHWVGSGSLVWSGNGLTQDGSLQWP